MKYQEVIALAISVLILVVAGWFWLEQVQAAKELLDMADG